VVYYKVGSNCQSPFSISLFLLYVDDLLKQLALTNYGCFINQECVNSFMYADDIILWSITVTNIQKMVNVCMKCLSKLDLPIDMSKCMLSNTLCCPIHFDMVDFAWVQEVRCLCVYIVNGKKFACNYSNAKKRFFWTFNNIILCRRVGSVNTNSLLIKSNQIILFQQR